MDRLDKQEPRRLLDVYLLEGSGNLTYLPLSLSDRVVRMFYIYNTGRPVPPEEQSVTTVDEASLHAARAPQAWRSPQTLAIIVSLRGLFVALFGIYL